MLASEQEIIRRLGVLEEQSGMHFIELADAASLWVVLKGGLDLFACKKSGDGTWGARHPFLSIRTGAAAFAFESTPSGLSLIAVPLPASDIVKLPLATLRDRVLSGDGWADDVLNVWIDEVARRLSGFATPLTYTDAATSQVIRVGDTPRSIVAVDGLVWLCQRTGTSAPFAKQNLTPVDSSLGFYPLSRVSWVEASPDSELEVLSTPQMLAQDQSWRGLRNFNATSMELLDEDRRSVIEAGRKQIALKAAHDRNVFTGALERLHQSISPTRARTTPVLIEDPVFRAMQLVASDLGITLVAPPEMMRGLPLQEPIQAIARASSLRVRAVTLAGDWWKHCDDPLLCFRAQTSDPVAVLPRLLRRPQLVDPGEGSTLTLSGRESLSLSSVAYMIYRPFPNHPLEARQVLRFGLDRCWPEVGTIALMGTVAGALALVMPYAITVTFSRLIPGSERVQLVQLTLLLLIVAVSTALFTFVRGSAVVRLQGRLDAALQSAVWDRLLKLPVPFFRNYGSGDLAQRSLGIARIREVLTGSAVTAVLSFMFSVSSYFLLFYYSVKLALVATVLVGAAFLITVSIGLIQVRYRRIQLEQSGLMSSRLLQFLTGISKFRVSGTEERAFAAWATDFAEQRKTSVQSRKLALAGTVFSTSYPVLCIAFIFYMNASGGSGGATALSTGAFLGLLTAFTQFLTAALAVSSTTTNLVSIVPIYERIRPILQTVPEVTEGKGEPGRLNGGLEVSNLTFAYNSEARPVLNDISLQIESGQSVAFVGASGSGKSTLLRLLLGFEKPSSGSVYYDGQDLAGLDVQAVRRQIGVVLQSSKPVSGSIFQNIVGSAPLTVDDAWHACRLAGLEEDIQSMPMGLHTMISDGGGGISGGQRQRLMIARAIVNKPRVLFFDEATSALDNRTQAIVNRSLTALQATRVIIAHRLSTIEHVDKIFVFDKGRVVQAGSYAQLLQQDGLFRDLATRQLT